MTDDATESDRTYLPSLLTTDMPSIPIVETSRVYMRRLALKHRHLHNKRRKSHNPKKGKRTKTIPNILTPEEKKKREKRQEDDQKIAQEKIAEAQKEITKITERLAGDLGKSATHWHRCLMQLARIALSERSTSWWNAFVSIRLKQINAGQ